MRILVVDVDQRQGCNVVASLALDGHEVVQARSGREARKRMSLQGFDVAVVGAQLPDTSGLELLAQLRSSGATVPVLMTAEGMGPLGRAQGLDQGADDWLDKPFDDRELRARTRALARRRLGWSSKDLVVGPVSFDPCGRVVFLDGRQAFLSAREMLVLEVLMRRPGRIVSKAQLLDALSQSGHEVSGNAIEVYIHRLRKKLDSPSVSITTLRGMGYSLLHVHVADLKSAHSRQTQVGR